MGIKYSVAVATYNGEKYIARQIRSILEQTFPVHEIIVSDDGSNDKTVDIIKSLDYKGVSIKIFSNTDRHGCCGNFENAIKMCTGDYIFLADQDDVWFPNKVEMFNAFISRTPSALCIASDGILIGPDGRKIDGEFSPIFRHVPGSSCKMSQEKYLTYIVQTYLVRGMALCVSWELLDLMIPFPKTFAAHDKWIVFCALCKDSFYLIHEKLVKYRIHDSNTCGHAAAAGRSFKQTISKVNRYRKNWNHSESYEIAVAMARTLDEQGLQDTPAYHIVQMILMSSRKEYEVLHGSGIKGAAEFIRFCHSDKVYRDGNKKSVMAYRTLRVLMSREQERE